MPLNKHLLEYTEQIQMCNIFTTPDSGKICEFRTQNLQLHIPRFTFKGYQGEAVNLSRRIQDCEVGVFESGVEETNDGIGVMKTPMMEKHPGTKYEIPGSYRQFDLI